MVQIFPDLAKMSFDFTNYVADMTLVVSKAGFLVDDFCKLVRLMDTGRNQNLLCVPESESCPLKIRAYFDAIRPEKKL